jgi:hypothetical protein
MQYLMITSADGHMSAYFASASRIALLPGK